MQGQPGQSRSRSDVSNARSAVFRILPDGATDVVWSSTTVTAFAIAPALQPGSVLIGTADKGRIYSVTNDGRDTLLLQSPEGQISSLLVRNNRSMLRRVIRENYFVSAANWSAKERLSRQLEMQS